ncbi:M23 family metallopeptidase [Mycolicibacterium arenosum]|uniref:M23 family metallopeptidase n=1 Tax=Mycolicibacterium arenosum TaxID=2952157 RepID=A0ABT1LXZ1_9MYCO|nr:M23 family metallopeptidase [Mycolicibacterium sp. CAU 1645]MCP9271746.1 M23 family metallopeptidase [Mycolicibacterium sp. CAU 1645]
MASHSSSRSPRRASTNARPAVFDADVTDIIPFNEFGDLSESVTDLDFCNSSAFDREARVISAPELDDLHHTDDLVPLRLVVPSEFAAAPGAERRSRAYRDSRTDISDGMDQTDVIDMRRGGSHRKLNDGHVKGKLVAAAMAIGATAAGGYTMATATNTPEADALVAAGPGAFVDESVSTSGGGMQIVSVAPAASSAIHSEELAKGAAFAAERAEREARLARPLFEMPTRGVWTSGFGYRWGVLHGGIDIANSIGTPILAASDGVVIDVGPTAGYGAWVKLRHSDGTVTLYGHINTWLVSEGQRVMAGDQIATMGNRGNSTGPHLHFEVLVNGSDRVDPTPWLAQRGLSPGKYSG